MTEIIEKPRRSPLRRAGCIAALVIWFLILLLPCFLIVLATQQEISVSTGGAPGQQLRLWLISEVDERGLALSTASVQQNETDAVCVETNVRYLLWAGSAEPVSYCECYQRGSESEAWALTSTGSAGCSG